MTFVRHMGFENLGFWQYNKFRYSPSLLQPTKIHQNRINMSTTYTYSEIC